MSKHDSCQADVVFEDEILGSYSITFTCDEPAGHFGPHMCRRRALSKDATPGTIVLIEWRDD